MHNCIKIASATVCFFIISCTTQHIYENKTKCIYMFLDSIKNGNYIYAENMVSRNTYTSNSYETMIDDIKRSSDVLIRYGIPSQNKWQIVYDTASDLIKIETYIIPMYKGFDSTNKLEEAYARISFDYTGHFIGDSIFHYELFTKKWHKPYY
jgi:hypothetical protein